MIEVAISIAVIGFALVAIIGILPRGLEVQRDNRAETIINQDGTFWIEAIRNGARGLDELPDFVSKIEIAIKNPDGTTASTLTFSSFKNGADIIGLLTTQAIATNDVVTAYVTALSGAAAEKDTSAASRDLAFRYLLRVQIHQSTNTAWSFQETTQPAASEPLTTLYDLNVELAYPLVQDDRAPTRKQAFRSLISRNVYSETRPDGETNYFFVP